MTPDHWYLPTRFPLVTMMDTGNDGHIGWAVAMTSHVAAGVLETRQLRRYIASGAYARYHGIECDWSKP